MIKWMDSQSKLVKIIFAIPFLHIVWVIYRLLKSAKAGNTLGIILAILLLVLVAIPVLWLLDIITIILYDRVLWID